MQTVGVEIEIEKKVQMKKIRKIVRTACVLQELLYGRAVRVDVR